MSDNDNHSGSQVSSMSPSSPRTQRGAESLPLISSQLDVEPAKYFFPRGRSLSFVSRSACRRIVAPDAGVSRARNPPRFCLSSKNPLRLFPVPFDQCTNAVRRFVRWPRQSKGTQFSANYLDRLYLGLVPGGGVEPPRY